MACIKKYFFIIIIGITLMLHIGFNSAVLCKSKVARVSDEAAMLHRGLIYYHLLFRQEGIHGSDVLKTIVSLKGETYHPPFYGLAQAIVWKILDIVKLMDEDLMILIVNSIFLCILMLSVFGLGSLLFNREVGLLSSVFVSFFPVVFGHCRTTMPDFPLMCMVSLTIYLMFKTDRFQNRLYCFLFGCAFGLAQLTKESSVIFMLGPFLYYAVISFLKSNKKAVITNLFIAAAMFAMFYAPVFLNPINRGIYKLYFFRCFTERTCTDWKYYIQYFRQLTGPLFLILFAPLTISYLANIKNREKLFLFWFFVPFVIFCLSPNRTIRFLLPILPAFAILNIQEIYQNKFFLKYKNIFISFLIVFSAVQYILFNFGFMEKNYYSSFNTAGLQSVKKDNCRILSSEIAKFFEKEKQRKDKFLCIVPVFDIGCITQPLITNLLIADLPVFLMSPDYEIYHRYLKPGIEGSGKTPITAADYVLDKTGEKYTIYINLNKKQNNFLHNYIFNLNKEFQENMHNYAEVKKIYHGKDTITIFKKK